MIRTAEEMVNCVVEYLKARGMEPFQFKDGWGIAVPYESLDAYDQYIAKVDNDAEPSIGDITSEKRWESKNALIAYVGSHLGILTDLEAVDLMM